MMMPDKWNFDSATHTLQTELEVPSQRFHSTIFYEKSEVTFYFTSICD